MILPKILVFPGSNRTGSHNARLAGAATKLFSQLDCEVTRISLRDYEMPLYDGDLEEEKGPPKNAYKLARQFAAHDGILIVSPEYNGSLPPLVKNTLDWVSRIKKDKNGPISPYTNTVFALAGCSPGKLGGLRNLVHLRAVLLSLSASLVTTEQAAIGNATSAFDSDDNLIDDAQRNMMQGVCASLVQKSRIMAGV